MANELMERGGGNVWRGWRRRGEDGVDLQSFSLFLVES